MGAALSSPATDGLRAAVVRAGQDLLARDMDEAAVSGGPVKRLLAALGWDVFDPSAVCREFRVGPGRVDYALRSAPATVDVFVEVKAPGKADEAADRQPFEYAFHQGVPLAVVTDGRTWSFYLPSGQGSCEDRRLYRLDIVERDTDECCSRLDRDLGRSNVASGVAHEYARRDHQDKARTDRLIATRPKVWRRLLDEPDDLLVDLLVEAIESETGERPETEHVQRFLRAQTGGKQADRMLPGPGAASGARETASRGTPAPAPRQPGGCGYSVQDGPWKPFKDGKATYLALLGELCGVDPEFPVKFARTGRGRKRAWIAQTPEALFPGRPDFQAKETSELRPGWFVGTQTNPEEFDKRARAACKAVGLDFGRDVKASFKR
ncbi:MAG: hypothetical protein J0L57_09095 [Burkholderiales bacterium]|nr:hypothetical protein [Burkholderiales bacterium]